MKSSIAIGIGAGLVSALLIAVIAKATPLALMLYLLAPLPIVIVALGWSHSAGLVAGATGGLALALAASPLRGFAFVVATALPAWWLAYLALLGRPAADGSGRTEWYPVGRLLAWVAVTAALSLTFIAIISSGDHASFREKTTLIVSTLVRIETGDDPNAGALGSSLVDALAALVPGLAAQGFTFLLVAYLWSAARIVNISGRLPRPWPDIPGLVMPRTVLWGFALGIGLSLVGGFPGVFGIALAGALATAFALQGLAAFHDRSRGRPGRGVLLFGLYLIVLLTQGLVLAVLMLFGLADTAFNLRRRTARAPTPKT